MGLAPLRAAATAPAFFTGDRSGDWLYAALLRLPGDAQGFKGAPCQARFWAAVRPAVSNAATAGAWHVADG